MPIATAVPATRPGTRRAVRYFRLHWVAVLLVLISVGYGTTVTALHGGELSPVDEWVYVDYLYKLPAQGMVHAGEMVQDPTLKILTCDGVIPWGKVGPPCANSFPDTSPFPNGGLTSAAPYTPIYFALTRGVGDAIHAVTGIDQLKSWRLTGVLWLAGSMIVLYALFRQWRIPNHAILAVGLGFIASPLAWWTFTYVSTDAPSFLIGTLLLYLAVRFTRGQGSGWWLPVVAVVGVLFKVTNILALWLVGLYLIICWIRELKQTHWNGLKTLRPGMPHRYSLSLLGFPLLALVLAAASEFLWLRIVQALAVSDRVADQGVVVDLTTHALLSEVTKFLPSTLTYNPIDIYVPGFVYAPLSWLCIAGVLGAFMLLRLKDRLSSMTIAVTIAAASFAPLLAITLEVTMNSYFVLPSRYGAPILGGFLLLIGSMLRNKAASWVLGAYAVALFGVGAWLSGYLAVLV